jgi:hypothetical protein
MLGLWRLIGTTPFNRRRTIVCAAITPGPLVAGSTRGNVRSVARHTGTSHAPTLNVARNISARAVSRVRNTPSREDWRP